jgi:hypothetical protein
MAVMPDAAMRSSVIQDKHGADCDALALDSRFRGNDDISLLT